MKSEKRFSDTQKIRKLLNDNPELPLMIFVDEETCGNSENYELKDIHSCVVNELAKIDNVWYDKSDYSEKLYEEMCECERYVFVSEKELDKAVEEKMKLVKFEKAIVVYV